MGSVNLDNTGSGSAVTLSSDGTSLLLDGTAIGGGGGADLYAANEVNVTAQPSATGDDAIAIGDSAVSSGANALAGPFSQASGTNSFAAAIGSTSTSWGAKADYGVALGFEARVQTGATYGAALGYSADSRASFGVAIGPDSYVTTNGTRAIAIGYQAEAGAAQSFAAGDAATISSSGTSAVALGTSYANAQDAFSAAIANNSSSYGATGNYSISIGSSSKATAEYSASFGQSNNVTGAYGAAFGRGNTVSSSGYCFGAENTSSASLAYAFGQKASSSTVGKFAFATSRFSSNGDAQEGKYILRSDTTNATAEALTTTNGTADATNQIILPNNSAYSFSGTIIARESAAAGSDYASWEIKGALLRDANAASTVLGNGIQNKLYATSGASAWAIALSADTTNGGLKIEVTGAASTNIRWVATVNTSEVTYA